MVLLCETNDKNHLNKSTSCKIISMRNIKEKNGATPKGITGKMKFNTYIILFYRHLFANWKWKPKIFNHGKNYFYTYWNYVFGNCFKQCPKRECWPYCKIQYVFRKPGRRQNLSVKLSKRNFSPFLVYIFLLLKDLAEKKPMTFSKKK